MNKTAQERGFLNHLRDKTNLSGRMLESINPEFADMMRKLRETDEKIRTAATHIKETARWARSFVAKRDYLSAAMNFMSFHEACRQIAFDLEGVRDAINLKHYHFLLNQFEDQHKERLFGYDPEKELERTAAEQTDVYTALTKLAGIGDFLFDAGKVRNQAMRTLEKRFSVGFLKTLREDSLRMVRATDEMEAALLSCFKRLATALATRDAQEYVSQASGFITRFATYHKAFVKYHQTNIVPLKEKHEEMLRATEEEKSRAVEEAAGHKAYPVGVAAPKVPGPMLRDMDRPLPESTPETPNSAAALDAFQVQHGPETLPAPKPLSMQQPPRAPISLDQTDERPTVVPPVRRPTPLRPTPEPFEVAPKKYVPKPKLKAAHEFLDGLQALAAEDDTVGLAHQILAYAAEIEPTDETRALQLIAIAEGMLEGSVDESFADDTNDAPPAPPTKGPATPLAKIPLKKMPAPQPGSVAPPLKPTPVDPLALTPPATRPQMVTHGLPEGRIDKKYFDIPFLRSITPDRIRITPASAQHLTQTFIQRLVSLGQSVANLPQHLEERILAELKMAIVRGIVLSSAKADDPHNPQDRLLDIYTYVSLPTIDKRLRGIVKLKVFCRLGVFNGTLSVRTIQRNFDITGV